MMKRMISLMSAAILALGGAAAPVGSGIAPAVSADGPYAITDLYAVLTADQTDGNRATIGSFSLDEGYTETDATFTLTGLDVDFSEYDKLYYMFALPYLLKEGESMSFSASATATITPKTAPFVDEEPASAYTVTSEPAVVKFDSSRMVLNVAFYDLQGIDLDCKIDVKLKMTDFKMTMPAPEPEAPAKTSISKAAVKAANKTYTGKALKPAPTAKLGGKTLKKGTDYTVSYKNNVKCGKATVTVKGKGNYTGTKSGSFIIKPKAVAAKKLTSPKTKQIKLTWTKAKGGVTGYQVQTALNKKFTKSKKTVIVAKASATSKNVTKLKKGTTYFARVRAYKTVGKTKYYGAWSTVKNVKCK